MLIIELLEPVKRSDVRGLAKIVSILLAFALLVALAYGVYQNHLMHKNLAALLEVDPTILRITGKFESVEYDSSGSNVDFGGSRDETLWILRVTGEHSCIYVHAVLYERFPKYEVVSVAPETHIVERRTNGMQAVRSEEVQRC